MDDRPAELERLVAVERRALYMLSLRSASSLPWLVSAVPAIAPAGACGSVAAGAGGAYRLRT